MYCLCEKYWRSGTIVDTARSRCSSQKMQPICRVRVRLIKRGWVLELPNRKADLCVIARGRFLLRNIGLIWSKLRRRLQPRRRSARRAASSWRRRTWSSEALRSSATDRSGPASRAYQRSAKSQSVSWHGDTSRQIIHQDQTLVPAPMNAKNSPWLHCTIYHFVFSSAVTAPPTASRAFFHSSFTFLSLRFSGRLPRSASFPSQAYSWHRPTDVCLWMCVWAKHCSVIQHLKCSWAKWPNTTQ